MDKLPQPDKLIAPPSSKPIAQWLLLGVAMLVIQVLLGGITRLTESGLSITEWKPITGALPPMNDVAWQAEFDKYKLTDQFKYVHQSFSLSDFKFIFFWEWFHRVWARLMALVFLTGFFYFLAKKQFNKKMIRPMVILFILGVLQGLIGWLMVKSGLVPEKYFVGHVELATHFIAAMVLLCYTLWFALSLSVKTEQLVINKPLQQFLLLLLGVLFFQLIYGAFMAGLKAAISAPTWPDINGQFIPSSITELSPWFKNLIDNNITIHFIHRGLAYLLFALVCAWWIMSRQVRGNRLFSYLRNTSLLLVLLQVILGIITVLNATQPRRLVVFGVFHQFVAMMLLMNIVALLFVVRKKLA